MPSQSTIRPKHSSPIGVKRREGDHDAAVLHLGPADVVLQHRREQTENLPVHVVDDGREEEQRADRPAVAAGGAHDAERRQIA